MKVALAVIFVVLAIALADEHRVTYVGYDHVLDYNPTTGTSRAFDIRRHLPKNDQCDYFVFPPLIEASPFVDALAASIPPESAQVTYLGNELFMMQDMKSASYVIRRCSGFMPQQHILPCDVYAIGHGEEFLAPNQYYYGGVGHVIRHNPDTQTVYLTFFDQDVHGGGQSFDTLVSGHLERSGPVDFAVIEIANPPMHLVVILEASSGSFSVVDYNPAGKTIAEIFGTERLAGTVAAGFRIKTLLESNVLAYVPNTGDFEVWDFVVRDGALAVDVIKQANLEKGHGCIHDDRQACIGDDGCGWCADTASCHQLSSDRVPCDGTTCQMIVDQFSPDAKKFQTEEHPISILKYGDAPKDDPVSPLRGTTNDATPILRADDFSSEKLLEGVVVNPSEGLVFIPPVSGAPPPCMDDMYVDPKLMPPVDLTAEVKKMNEADGLAIPPIETSPLGSVQSEQDCSDQRAHHTRANHTHPTLYSLNEKMKPMNGKQDGDSKDYRPLEDGTAREEDLMNGIRSFYSSLMPKEADMAAVRSDITDPPLPLPRDIEETLVFKPKDNARVRPQKPLENVLIPQESLLSSGTMESGSPLINPDGGKDAFASQKQQNAMHSAQFVSPNIASPPQQTPAQMTRENRGDLTGMGIAVERSLGQRDDGTIIEGWALADHPIEVAQVEPVTLKAPEPPVDSAELREAAEAQAAALADAIEAKERAAAAVLQAVAESKIEATVAEAEQGQQTAAPTH